MYCGTLGWKHIGWIDNIGADKNKCSGMEMHMNLSAGMKSFEDYSRF